MATFPVEQLCEFGNVTVADEQYYACTINNVKLLNESAQIVTTNTTSNLKSNDDVQLIVYNKNNLIHFIPNSIFEIFPNVECFLVTGHQFFSKIEPHYLKGAKKLKIFHIEGGKIQSMDANLFVEAPNLEIINLYCNQIKSIHRWTFSGLKKLQYIYLAKNPIQILHPKTFSHLKYLNNLHLTKSSFNKEFIDFKDFQEIEEEISMKCQYDEEDSPNPYQTDDENQEDPSFKKLVFINTQVLYETKDED